MGILIGILVYGFGVLFFCALARANGPDLQDLFANSKPADERFESMPARGVVHAPEARF